MSGGDDDTKVEEKAQFLSMTAALASVLAIRLRGEGLALHPSDVSVILSIGQKRARWPLHELVDALVPALAHQSSDAALIRNCIDTLARELTKQKGAFALEKDSDREIAFQSQSPETNRWRLLANHSRAFAKRLSLKTTVSPTLRSAANIFRTSLRWLFYLLSASLPLLAFAIFLLFFTTDRQSPVQIPCPGCPTITATDGTLMLDSLFAAVSVGGFVLLLWRAVILEREASRNASASPVSSLSAISEQSEATERLGHIRPIGDQSFFRPSTIGGPPPKFLRPKAATSIAEMYSYRPGEADPARIDLDRTLNHIARGGDPSVYVAERRRVLPLVVSLIDRRCDGYMWNTLPIELARDLSRRGINHEEIVFPGSFFAHARRKLTLRPEGERLNRIIADSSWTVTLLFGEAHRLAQADIDLLAKVGENGALAFLDMRDSALWDRRHATLERSGVILSEATERGVTDVLSRLFAPDRRRPLQVNPYPRRQSSTMTKETWETALRRLGGVGNDGLDWASDCALVEPVSFALAEKLRNRYASLATSAPSLAYSRLAALPGAWVGPEGLRFEATIRRRLLNGFAARSQESRAKTAAIIREEIAKTRPSTDETTATAIHAWVEARAEAFFDAPDRALKVAMRAEIDGLVGSAPIRDFLDRVARGERSRTEDMIKKEWPEDIQISVRPSRSHLRFRLAERLKPEDEDEAKTPIFENADIEPWRLSAPNGRLRSSQIRHEISGAFLPGARTLLLSGREGVESCDMTLMRAEHFETPDVLGQTREILTAPQANIAILIGERGLVARVDFKTSKTGQLSADRVQIVAQRDADWPLVSGGLSVDGTQAFFAARDSDTLFTHALDNQDDETVREISVDFMHNGVLAVDADWIAIGDKQGAVRVFAMPVRGQDELRVSGQNWASIGSEPELLAFAKDPRAGSKLGARLLVAACEGSRVVVFDEQQVLAEIQCGWDLKRIAPLAGSFMRGSLPTETSEASEHLFVAALGRDGQFDVLGVPLDLRPAGPIWLLEPGPDTMMSRQRTAVAVGAQSRRVAFHAQDPATGEHFIEVRPLVQMIARAPQWRSPNNVETIDSKTMESTA